MLTPPFAAPGPEHKYSVGGDGAVMGPVPSGTVLATSSAAAARSDRVRWFGAHRLANRSTFVPDSNVIVFARDERSRVFAMELGAHWAEDIGERAPEALSAIIDTTPAWRPVVEAMGNLAPGGRLVINAIREEDDDKDALLRLDYGAACGSRRKSSPARTSRVATSRLSFRLRQTSPLPSKRRAILLKEPMTRS